jgi:hypothetical protein
MKGWAVAEAQHGIVVNSVADSRRSAIVNWFAVSGPRVVTLDSATDEQIEGVWRRLAPRYGAEVIEVEVTPCHLN